MKYDLVVIGGGTAGCAAAYTAGKLGLKTLLLEKNIHLGGSITSGLVVPAMKSSDNQINTEFFNILISEMSALGGQTTYQDNPGWFNPELMKIALDNLMQKANVDVQFGVAELGAATSGNTIESVSYIPDLLSVYNNTIQSNVDGLSVSIDTRYIVDATGNCDFGKILNCNFLEKKSEVQPTSLRFIMGGIDLEVFSKWLLDFDPDRNVTTVEEIEGKIHLSTAYTWDEGKNWALAPIFNAAVEEGCLKSADCNYFQIFTIPGMPNSIAFNCPRLLKSTSLAEARASIYRLSKFCRNYLPGFENSYISNIADMLGVRVSRRIKGKYIYTLDDILSGKKFENPVVIANYPIDVHSSKKNYSTLKPVQDYQLPIEALMSADYDNLFVAGRCVSADFMAQGALRVQTSCFSMGEGVAKHIAKLIRD